MTLASPLLRQIFSAVRKALKAHPETQILFHFVPEQHIVGSTENPSALYPSVEILCHSVYDRILQPVDRLMSRQLTEHERIRNYFQEPAFTLARPVYNKVSYVRAPRSSLDVMDRHTFLHVGYQISPCGKWILAACVDERGEAHDLGVWLTQTPGDAGEEAKCAELYMVDKLWQFAVQFARKSNVEWRIAFAKLGAMGETELLGTRSTTFIYRLIR
jgi:Mediator complex subunit 13 C-terminal.